MSQEFISFGEYVQAQRNRLGLTRPGLANQVGCSPVTIKKIERDERRPSLQIAELLAENLQIPESEKEDFIHRARGQYVANMSTPATAPLVLPADKHRYTPELPAQSTSFIGREAELEKIGELITNPEVRLVTILAGGGMGKTRLAMEVARSHENDFVNGIVFVPLAPVDLDSFSGSLDPITATIAGQVKFVFQGNETPRDQLLDFLHEKEMLLILDNFEHLINHTTIVDEILTVASNIKILVTSRESLNLQAEWVITLAGLPLETAVSLFEQRAIQVKNDFSLSAELEMVQHICRLVDGLPLGLELAAAWVRLIPCASIVTEIEKSFDFLAGKMRNLPTRHRSLRAVFESSWQLLTAEEQLDLQKLSVFRGGFDVEAATAVTGATLWSLSNLVDKSLLTVQGGRYKIHERLRQFAAEKLNQSENSYEQIRTRHARVYLEIMAQQIPRLQGREIKEASSKLTAELDNIRAMFRWALQQDWFPEIIRTFRDAYIFYDTKGLVKELLEIFLQVVARLRLLVDAQAEDLAKAPTSPYSLWLGQALAVLAFSQVQLGLMETLEEHVTESLEKLRASKAKPQEILPYLIENSVALSEYGKTREAKTLLQEVLLQREEINTLYQAIALQRIGMDYRTLGRTDLAEKYLQESIRLLESAGEQYLLHYSYSTLGRMAAEQGKYEEASKLHNRNLAMRTDLNDLTGLLYSFRDLGDLAQLQGDPDQARSYYERGLTQAQKIGLGKVASQLWWGLGNLAVREEDFAKARHMYRQSRVYERGYSFLGNSLIANPGWADLGLEEWEAAESSFREMLSIGLEVRAGKLISEAITGLAYLKAQNGAFEMAIEWLTLVTQHSLTIQDTKDRANKLLNDFRAELPAKLVAAAETRGRELDLWETAVSIPRQTSSLPGKWSERD